MNQDFPNPPEPVDQFTTPTPPPPAPAKKNNTVWIIVAVAAVLLCCCCLIVAIVLLYQYGDQIFGLDQGTTLQWLPALRMLV